MMGVTLTLPFSLEIIERSVFMFKFEQRENDVADNNSNLQAIMTGIRKIEIQPCPMPECGADDIVVHMQYVGICGSDIHFLTEGRIGKKIIDKPLVLGHEGAGIVVETGKNVTDIAVGDNVAIEPGIPCGKCEYCKSGKYNICPDVRFMASPPNHGCLKRYINYPAYMAFKLPDEFSLIEGAMLEPLCVGLHSAMRGEVKLGKTVAVLGAGPIGLMTMLSAKAMSASKIYVADLFKKRLENARAFGADETFNASDGDIVDAILEATYGKGVDIVFEAAGNPTTMVQAAKLVKRGGVIVLVGNLTKETTYPFHEIAVKEADIRTVFRYRNMYPIAIDAIKSGKIDLKQLNPDIFDFADTHKAFEYTIQNAKDIIKSIVKID